MLNILDTDNEKSTLASVLEVLLLSWCFSI